MLAFLLTLITLLVTHPAPTHVSPYSVSPDSVECEAVARVLYESHDYMGTQWERACFGEEDDARVGMALDYGTTVWQYAREEAAEGGSYSPPR
jgi:hypothetical protein